MGLVYDRRGREDDQSGIVQAQAMRLVKPLQAIYPPSRMWPSSRIRMMHYLEQIAISYCIVCYTHSCCSDLSIDPSLLSVDIS